MARGLTGVGQKLMGFGGVQLEIDELAKERAGTAGLYYGVDLDFICWGHQRKEELPL